jgi:UDP-2-acetamido-3-amino-2,3-dideoxy-glucuronate N-acetyltransferase
MIGQGVFVGEQVMIGNGCRIQNGAQIFTGVTLEEDVFIGPHVVFTNVLYPRAFKSQRDSFKKTLVKKGAMIGANATILCGVTIGGGAMIGAGSVITRDISPFEVVSGASKHLRFIWKD